VQSVQWAPCQLDQISSITNAAICYTTEAFKYAQASSLIALLIFQWISLVVCKTRRMSTIYSEFNLHMLLAVLLETAVILIVCYVPGINYIFDGRPVNLSLFGMPALVITILFFAWEELRKALIRN